MYVNICCVWAISLVYCSTYYVYCVVWMYAELYRSVVVGRNSNWFRVAPGVKVLAHWRLL